MSKLVKLFAAMVLIVGAIAITPGTAAAQHPHRGHGGGYYRGGGHFGGGWGPAFGLGLGLGYPYYAQPYYYASPADCGWVRVLAWRNHHRVWRRAWRCW